jgi:hypothetical protein
MVAVEIFRRVLTLAVYRLMEFFHNLGPGRFRVGEVRIHIIDEDCQGLRSLAKLGRSRAARPRRIEHDPSPSEMHLSAIRRIAISVMLGEVEYLSEPCYSGPDVLICDVRQDGVYGNGSILHMNLNAAYCTGLSGFKYPARNR